jgi:hypothetical protein
MCMIVGEIEKVGKTRIAVAAAAGHRQLVVYSNQVTLAPGGRPVAMILPFYNGGGHGVEVVPTVPEDAALFESLEYACKDLRRTNGATDYSFNAELKSNAAPRLEVLRSGSYRYSVAPTAADIVRADPRVFTSLPADLQALVDQYQAQQFGFIVCLLDASADYAPFAYVSDRVPGSESLFVPTRHYHTHAAAASFSGARPTVELGGGLNGLGSVFTTATGSSSSSATDAADWDHDVYVLGLDAAHQVCASLNNMPPSGRAQRPLRLAGWKKDSPLRESFQGADGSETYVAHIAKYRVAPGKNATHYTRRIISSPLPNDDMHIVLVTA